MSFELEHAADFIKWINTKAQLNANAAKAQTRIVRRGQVYWCHFGLNVGSEISKTTPRPAVIIQNYYANKNSSNTIVVPVTHSASKLPCMVPLTPVIDEEGKVLLDGKVDVAHIMCVSKARLGNFITRLSDAKMKEIDRAVAESLDLSKYYKDKDDKYKKLKAHLDVVKEERNATQDQLARIREIVAEDVSEGSICEKLRKFLDMGQAI